MIFLSACGGSHGIDPAATTKYVGDVVFQKTGFRAVDVRCQSGVPATAGGRFKCRFTGPERSYTAYLHIVKVHGHRAAFRLETQPVELACADTPLTGDGHLGPSRRTSAHVTGPTCHSPLRWRRMRS